MKKLSDFKGVDGIVIGAKVLEVIMEMLQDQRNMSLKDEPSTIKMFTGIMENSPDKMMKIFAILSEKEPAEYECDGAEAMTNMLLLANDPVIISLFTSQGRKRDAIASGSATESSAG
jgi:hypothetical protein